MNLIMIFFISLFLQNPKKVLLGNWKGDRFEIIMEKIKGDQVYGYWKSKSKKENFKTSYKEVIWDQPCSKAYECELFINGEKLRVLFIGYEKQSEVNDCLICEGELTGLEAQIINKGGVTFLYKKIR